MNRKIPDLIKEYIKQEHVKGVGVTELARTFGVSRSTIYDLIRSTPRAAKETVPISTEGILIARLAGVSPMVASSAYCKCVALDKLALTELTPSKVLNAGLNIGRSIDTNTILHSMGYILAVYPIPEIISLELGEACPLSWVDVYILLKSPLSWVQCMSGSGKVFEKWGLFKEDAQC